MTSRGGSVESRRTALEARDSPKASPCALREEEDRFPAVAELRSELDVLRTESCKDDRDARADGTVDELQRLPQSGPPRFTDKGTS